MAHPQTIQIFLPDGNPRGIKIAEITNRTIKAILFPRNQFEAILQRSELANVGFYWQIMGMKWPISVKRRIVRNV